MKFSLYSELQHWPGKSAGRQPDGHDTDNNSSDFSVLTAPSPGATNS